MDSYATTHEAELVRAKVTRELLKSTKIGVSKRNRSTLSGLYGSKSDKAKKLAAIKAAKGRGR